MIPWVQRPIIFDVRSQPRNIPVNTPSKDLQNVSITLRILYRPEIAALPKIFSECVHWLQCLYTAVLSPASHACTTSLGVLAHSQLGEFLYSPPFIPPLPSTTSFEFAPLATAR